MSFRLLDLNKTKKRPKFWLAKPNKEIISRMIEVDSLAKLDIEFGLMSELSFELPKYLTRNNQKVENKNFNLIANKMLIKMEFDNQVEWFVIENLKKDKSNTDTIPVTAHALQFELNGKTLYEYSGESILPEEIFDITLENTGWSVGFIDPILANKYRTYNFTNISKLNALHEIASTINGVLQFDTVNQTVSAYDESTISEFHGLRLSDKNYIDTMDDELDGQTIVTRLYPIGLDGLNINRVNPTGSSYIENFNYYLQGFERDENKDVISSSKFMSDSLAHAILDYQEKVELNKDTFETKQGEYSQLLQEKDTIQIELDSVSLASDLQTDRLDIQRANSQFDMSEQLLTSFPFMYSRNNIKQGYYFVQVRLKQSGSIGYGSINGSAVAFSSNWTSMKFDYTDNPLNPIQINFNSTSLATSYEFYIANITPEEYTDSGDLELQLKYNPYIMKRELERVTNLMTSKETQIINKQNEIENFLQDLALENNFTLEQLQERERFVHEYFWTEDNHIDDRELYEDGIKKLEEINKPNRTMTLSLFNFLNSLSEQRNWDKLKIGSKIYIHYSGFDISSVATLLKISYDFESNGLSVTISDTKDLMSDEEKLVQLLYNTSSSASRLDLKKTIYDNAVDRSLAIEELLNSKWDATLRRIVAGVDESVDIGKRGIVIRNPNFPEHMLVAQAGVLAISEDGGNSFRNALTTDGLIAEEIIGQIIIGEKLFIQDANGIITLNGSLQTIKDADGFTRVELGEYSEGQFGLRLFAGSIRIVGGLPTEEIDPDAVDRWDSAEQNAKDYTEEQLTGVTDRISTVELQITEDAIVNTVRQSTSYQNDLESKASTESLTDLASKDELSQGLNEANQYTDSKIFDVDGQFTNVYEEISKVDQKADNIEFKFTKAGGVNLIKNSIGFAGTDLWEVDGNVSTIQNADLDVVSGGSAFLLGAESELIQRINVPSGTYTLSSLFKKAPEGIALMEIYHDGVIETFMTDTNKSYDYEKVARTITLEGNEMYVRFFSAFGTELIVTNIMLNTGDLAFEWSLSYGEMYNTNVQMDINGMKVKSNVYDGYTAITPEEFAGYARVDGVMTKVFTVNKDVTEMKKTKVEDEFTMNPIKIVTVTAPNYTGWAFIADE